MATAEKAQTAIDEQVIENPAMVEALDRRGELKAKARDARKRAKEQDDRVKLMLEEFQLPEDCVVRFGSWRITRSVTAAREVAFSVEPKQRTSISRAEDDAA